MSSEMFQYHEMIQYVKEKLLHYDEAQRDGQNVVPYHRFEHTMRVYHWMQVLYDSYPQKEQIDIEALSIATIFHDIGYCEVENIHNHAEGSARYCREYLEQKDYPPAKIDFICDLIARHSDKKNMYDIPMELVLLREADLLDDTGAQGLVFDIWMETACNKDVSFESILKHMEKYTVHLMQVNPMRTEKAKEIWEEKRKLTEAFVNAYRKDLKKVIDKN